MGCPIDGLVIRCLQPLGYTSSLVGSVGIKPTWFWLKVRCINHSATIPKPTFIWLTAESWNAVRLLSHQAWAYSQYAACGAQCQGVGESGYHPCGPSATHGPNSVIVQSLFGITLTTFFVWLLGEIVTSFYIKCSIQSYSVKRYCYPFGVGINRI